MGNGGLARIRGPTVDDKTKVEIFKAWQWNVQRQQAYGYSCQASSWCNSFFRGFHSLAGINCSITHLWIVYWFFKQFRRVLKLSVLKQSKRSSNCCKTDRFLNRTGIWLSCIFSIFTFIKFHFVLTIRLKKMPIKRTLVIPAEWWAKVDSVAFVVPRWMRRPKSGSLKRCNETCRGSKLTEALQLSNANLQEQLLPLHSLPCR